MASKSEISVADIVGISIATLALGLSAWTAFKPVNDGLEISLQQMPYMDNKVTLGRGYYPVNIGKSLLGSVGPIDWDVMVFNPSDQPVSIVKLRAFPGDDSAKQFDDQIEKFTVEHSPTVLSDTLPIDIPGRSVRRIRLSLKLDIALPPDESCENLDSMEEIAECYVIHGIDLFGNELNYRGCDEGGVWAEYKNDPVTPLYGVEFVTGDGSKFVYPLEFSAPNLNSSCSYE